jgi:hypothetical protein
LRTWRRRRRHHWRCSAYASCAVARGGCSRLGRGNGSGCGSTVVHRRRQLLNVALARGRGQVINPVAVFCCLDCLGDEHRLGGGVPRGWWRRCRLLLLLRCRRLIQGAL